MLGFFGKFMVLQAAFDAGLAWLAILGVVASVIGAFYYLRLVYYMYFGEEVEGVETNRSPVLLAFLCCRGGPDGCWHLDHIGC